MLTMTTSYNTLHFEIYSEDSTHKRRKNKIKNSKRTNQTCLMKEFHVLLLHGTPFTVLLSASHINTKLSKSSKSHAILLTVFSGHLTNSLLIISMHHYQARFQKYLPNPFPSANLLALQLPFLAIILYPRIHLSHQFLLGYHF